MFKKNIFGRLIVTVLAAMLALTVFTACDDNEDPPDLPDPAAVNGMVVIYNPTRTLYYVGEEEIDLTGGMFYLTYDDESVSPNYPMSKQGHTTIGFDATVADESQTITYKYGTYSKTFTIEISEITIEITNPTKRNWYYENVTKEEIELEGLMIEVTPTSKPDLKETFEATTRGVTVKSISLNAAKDELTVTVEYLGKTAEFVIDRIEANPES